MVLVLGHATTFPRVRECVNKKTDMSANGGGVNCKPATTIDGFFKIQNVLERMNMYFGKISLNSGVFLKKSYILDHSKSIDIFKEEKKMFSSK